MQHFNVMSKRASIANATAIAVFYGFEANKLRWPQCEVILRPFNVHGREKIFIGNTETRRHRHYIVSSTFLILIKI